MLDAALWVMTTGAPWRDLPERFGPWQSAYDRFRRWRPAGTLDRAVARLQRDLDRDGLIDWSAFCIDSTTARASRAAAGARKRGRQPSGPRSRASRRIMRWGGRAAALRPSFTS
jgi:transposase